MTSKQQQELFNYLSKEHGITVLQTDMQEIERILETDMKPYRVKDELKKMESDYKTKIYNLEQVDYNRTSETRAEIASMTRICKNVLNDLDKILYHLNGDIEEYA